MADNSSGDKQPWLVPILVAVVDSISAIAVAWINKSQPTTPQNGSSSQASPTTSLIASATPSLTPTSSATSTSIPTSTASPDLKPPKRCVGDGCDWQGSWSLEWEAPNYFQSTGTMQLDYGKFGITGTYDNGTIEGTYVNENLFSVQGKWTRTNGSSGGDCQSGNFVLNMSDSGSNLNGCWDYCGRGKRWRWSAKKVSQ
jgi:hypothetical protein